uniref:Uncharacterized protein n=1 Tax=Hippocampus comes TaxID=109280 RepID=A0A3Q2YD50_HIPCM
MESLHVWEHLYTLPGKVASKTMQEVPVVVDCIRVIVTKSTDTLLTHLVTMVTYWQANEEPGAASSVRVVPESVLAKVPKSWNYRQVEARGRETGKGDSSSKTVTSLAIQAMSFIFTNLPLVVASLPLPIRYLFQAAEQHLSQHARQLRSMGLLLWCLFNCLIRSLGEPRALEGISGLALNCQAKDRLALLAECLQASMGIQQKVLQALEEKRPKWMNMQLQKARKLCINSESGMAAAELTEQKMGLMLLEVCHKAGGSDYLRHIHHIIQGNEVGKTFNSPQLLLANKMFSLRFTEPVSRTARFVLIHLQVAMVEWAWEWTRLLPAYQDMCQITFKTLLANRKLIIHLKTERDKLYTITHTTS